MTVETRLSFPEGGTECPPETASCSEGSPASSSSSSSASGASAVVSGERKVEGSKTKRSKTKAKRCKSRRAKQVMLETTNTNVKDQSSRQSGTSTSQEETPQTSANSVKTEKNDDLKKPKTKNVGDGTKEDTAASRKSMRLRLRRGRTDNNSDDLLTPKERPRYFEDLRVINFEDDKTKVMFMDALGMSPRCKIAKKESQPEDGMNVICNNISIRVMEEDQTCSVLTLNECVQTERTTITVKRDTDNGTGKESIKAERSKDSGYQIEASGTTLGPSPSTSSPPIQQCIKNLKEDCMDSEDEDGWENWVQTISPIPTSVHQNFVPPSQNEINDSLKRLVKLGTEVKLIMSGIC